MDTPTVQPPAPPIQQPIPVPPQSKNYSNIVIVILLIIIGVLVGMELGETPLISTLRTKYLGAKPTPTSIPTPTPTPDPTADWKTYTSAVIGASIKYPVTWTYIENQKYTTFETSIPTLEKRDGKTINYSFELMQEDPSNYSQWSKDSTTKILSTITMNGMSFERYLLSDKYYSLNFIYKTSNGKIIRFMLFPYTATEKPTVIDSTITQILSTFTFTEPTPYTCPANGWVDCMPGTTVKPECSTAAMAWYKANCPDFKGGAY